MANFEVVVAGGPNNNTFAVANFTNPGSPTVVQANPGFGGGCAVAANGNLVAVGNLNGGQVVLFDLTNPAAPMKLGTLSTVLSGIGAIAFDGTRVLVGEMNGIRAVLIDVSNPNSPTILSTLNTGIGSIASIALSGTKAVASGPNDFTMDIIDYTNPGSPTRQSFNPVLGGSLTVDLDGSLAAVGDQNGVTVAVVDISGPTVLGTANSGLGGIFSISIKGSFVVAGSTNEFVVSLIDFTDPSSPVVVSLNPSLGGGCTVVRSNTRLAIGAVNGFIAKLFSVSGNTTATLGSANVGVDSIATIAVTDFSTGVTPPPAPKLALSANSIAFGSVAVCQSGTKTLTLKNMGNATLNVTSIAASAPFSCTPASGTILGGASLTVTVKFTPVAVGPSNGTLTIKSNDPANPSAVVALTGTATPMPPRHLVVDQTNMALGACLVNDWIAKRLTLTNTSPCDALLVTLVSSGSAVFPLANADPTTLPANTTLGPFTIPGGTSHKVVVAFGPTSAAPFNTTVTITSNDPVNPSMTVQVSGTGVLAQATSAVVILDHSGSMADPAAQGGTKIDALKSAVGLFVDLLPQGQGDFIGSVEFNDTAHGLTGYAAVDAAQATTVKNAVSTLTPSGTTSIGSGLNLGFDQLIFDAHTPRQVLMVFTDGMENTAPWIADVEPNILQQNIEVYAVGLGGATDIDAAKLSALAASSSGKFFASDDALILRKNFIQVLADAFRMNMAGDPVLTIARGATIDVPFELTKCERRLRFVCAWDDQDEQLDLTLVAPDGEQYSPGSPASNLLVRYVAQPGYAFYNLVLPPLDSDTVIGPLVVGTWKLRVSGAKLKRAQERFTSSLVVEQGVTLKTHVSFAEIAGTSMLRVDVQENGIALPGAEVSIHFSAPKKSAQAILCKGLARQKLQESVVREPSAKGRKATSAKTLAAPHPVVIPTKVTKLVAKMDEKFTYAVRLPEFVRDGIYQMTIQVRVPACGGMATRYAQLAVAPAQLLSTVHTKTSVVALPGAGSNIVVTVTPRDARNNLIGVGLARQIATKPPKGSRVLQVIDKFNGSYEIVLARKKAASGELSVSVGEKNLRISIPARPKKAVSKGRKRG
jgi:hypothetical protein